MAAVRKPRTSPPDNEHPLRDLLLVAGIVLAALQVIPVYVSSRTTVLVIVAAVVVASGFAYFLLRVRGRVEFPWKRAALPLGVVALFGGATFFGQYSLRTQLNAIADANTAASMEPDPDLRRYLDAAFDEHSSQWNGQFERLYARPTLYLLTRVGTDAKPTEVQNCILLWRSGSAGIGKEFVGVAGIAGETLPQTANDIDHTAQRYLSYVQRPMADSDLLNRNTKGEGDSVSTVDDIPRCILVLGDPASGKSSMLDRIDMIQARRARGSMTEPIPVLIRLKGLAGPDPDLLHKMVSERLGACSPKVLGKRNLVLLVDALDETVNPVATSEAIAKLMSREPYSKTVDRIIVTGRVLNYTSTIHGYPQALRYKGFTTAILYGLDQTAIEKRILSSSLASDQKSKIMQKLADDSSRSAWLQFLRMPMNFDLISEIMGELEPGDIGHGQTEILRRFVKNRFEQKNIVGAERDAGISLLRTIALNTLSDGVSARSREFGLKDGLARGGAYGSIDVPGAELDAIRRRLSDLLLTGLIQDKGGDRYKFCHLNLQDFFISEALHDLSEVDPSDVAWRQIILFFAGRSDGDLALKLVKEHRDANATQYLEELLRQVNGIRESLHQNLPLSYGAK
ncbi:hypothetical protein HZ994_15105 [Akkermansiaceae bacterium]|nr:hypothetical protein HZ994_15105 [Akkermansiaceae bacterium]